MRGWRRSFADASPCLTGNKFGRHAAVRLEDVGELTATNHRPHQADDTQTDKATETAREDSPAEAGDGYNPAVREELTASPTR